MNKFVRNLITEWRRLELPTKDATYLVAVSGGADSLSLLLALVDLQKRSKIGHRLVIAHFNHRLRGNESDLDEDFVRKTAGRFDLELALGRGEFQTKENLEQKARRARYRFLTETAAKLSADGIITAHTLNDQAETFLINLIRGSGLEGLGAMKSVRRIDPTEEIPPTPLKKQGTTDGSTKSGPPASEERERIILIRPLLAWARREMTEQYCHDQGVEYRYDTMNEDRAYKRVRIRKILLPLLRDFNPNIIDVLARTAFLLQEDFQALEKIRMYHLPGFEHLSDRDKPEFLPVSELKNLFPSMRRSILRNWLKHHRGNLRGLDSKHMAAIESLIFSRKSGKIVELPRRTAVKKENGKLIYQENKG